jgi:hypothetical protein
MSAPPLPEVFGNYALGEFAEVVAPQAVNWLPQTAGWAWLGAGVLAVVLHRGWLRLRRWHRNRYRREAVARLKQLGSAQDTSSQLTELNRLLKITAMAAFSRERVARLSGMAWVDFLNAQCPEPPFTTAQGQLLAEGPYRAGNTDNTGGELVAAAQRWVLEHEAPAGV